MNLINEVNEQIAVLKSQLADPELRQADRNFIAQRIEDLRIKIEWN